MKNTICFGNELRLTNGLDIKHYHEQDCCEQVYADFSALKDTTIENEQFQKIEIEFVEDSGFRLNGYFVPCYNVQNGYYSSDLQLIFDAEFLDGNEIEIMFDGKTVVLPQGCGLTIDISKCVEDDID